eukprot:3931645-Rhodomonas_salina.1
MGWSVLTRGVPAVRSGCTALAAALQRKAMPLLVDITMDGSKATSQGVEAVCAYAYRPSFLVVLLEQNFRNGPSGQHGQGSRRGAHSTSR